MDRPLNFYLAARYSRRVELCSYKADLEARGHKVPARWLLGGHQAGNNMDSDRQAKRFATEDLEDVLAADVIVSFTEEPRQALSRGGRHVELGVGIGLRRAQAVPAPKLIVVGPIENVFHTLDDIDAVFGSWDELLGALDALPATCATPGCNQHPWHRQAPSHADLTGRTRSLAEIIRECWQIAEDHGFHGPVPPHNQPRTFGDCCALIHTEVSEAFEAWRGQGDMTNYVKADGKLEGPAVELADVVIRCLDAAVEDCGLTAQGFADLIEHKIAYNRSRPYKHGKAL